MIYIQKRTHPAGHEVLEKLYDDMMPLCGRLIGGQDSNPSLGIAETVTRPCLNLTYLKLILIQSPTVFK